MAQMKIVAFLTVIVMWNVLVTEATSMSEQVIQEMRAERHKLVRDIELISHNHKRHGKGYAQVRLLLHKFYDIVAQKRGVPRQYDGEEVLNAIPQFDDGTELSKNRNIAADLFENDMVLTVEQVQKLVDKADAGARDAGRKRRMLISDTTLRWPGARFSYRFAVEDSSWQDVIRSAIAQWEAETCVRFAENGEGDDYVQFFKGDGCYSSVGRTGGAQQISIGDGCELMAIVAHEIGHTLGFWHEQSRPDRDDYISVKMNNMIAGTQGQVEKRSPSEVIDYGIPYDLGSVMHYGPRAFAYDASLFTLETDDPKYQNTIGQRTRLSFIDVKQMNKAYCDGKCTANLGCKNYGYENPNNCDECKCPEGLGGRLCDEVQSSSCGQDLRATGEWQTLSVTDGDSCYWRISSNGGKVRLEMKSVGYECRDTCMSYVEVKYNGNVQQTGYRLCCDASGGEILSKDDFVLIISKGAGSFELRYKSEGGSVDATPPTFSTSATATAGVTPTPATTAAPLATATAGATPTAAMTDAPLETERPRHHHRTTTVELTPSPTPTTPLPTTERHHNRHHHKHHTTTTFEPTTTHHSRRHHHKHTTTTGDFEF